MGDLGPPVVVLGLLIVLMLYAAAYGVSLHDNVLIWGAAAFLQLPFLILDALASTSLAIILVPLAIFGVVKYVGGLEAFMGEEFLCYAGLAFVIVVMSGVV